LAIALYISEQKASKTVLLKEYTSDTYMEFAAMAIVSHLELGWVRGSYARAHPPYFRAARGDYPREVTAFLWIV
jgi:hypothetical protein